MRIIIAEDLYLTETYLRTHAGPTTLNAFTLPFLAAEKKCSALRRRPPKSTSGPAGFARMKGNTR
jgi:hypothetical protein